MVYISFVPSGFAVFQSVWKGYQVSAIGQSLDLNEKINEFDFIFNDQLNDWKFIFSPGVNESNLAALFDFQSEKTKTKDLNFELSKTTYKYGTFSLNYRKREYDLSEWSDTRLSLLSDSTLFENRTSLNYTYDFLDRSKAREYDFIVAQNKTKTKENLLEVDKGRLSFFTTYIQAKFQLYSVRLSGDFVKEAKRRVDKTKRRVKDGVSRKIDLFQAESSLINRKESLESNRSNLKENLATLENILKRKIDQKQLDSITWKKRNFSYWKKSIVESEHYSVELTREKMKASVASLAKIKDENGTKLTFNASLESNAIDKDQSSSFDEHIETRTKNMGVSLSLVIPLGIDKRSALSSRALYEMKKEKLDFINVQDEVVVRKASLLKQIAYYEKIISLSTSKVELASQILKEQNKMYLRGQTNFEEIIRAEEAYVNTQLSEKKILLEFELLVANYAFLNNSIKTFLNSYRD